MNWSYVLLMLAAISAGALISRGTQRHLPLRSWEKLGLGLGAFLGAMLGAKLPFLFSDWTAFVTGWGWFQDGKTILTGLVGGYLGVEAAKWSLGVTTRTGDTFVLPVAAAIAIGRLGCFSIGCCYGKETQLPWGVVFSQVDAAPRHPTQLYEALFHGMAGLLFYWLGRNDLFTGQRIKLYMILYAAYRFGSEWLRPEARLYGGFTGYQVASLVIIALFIGLWARESGRPRSSRQGLLPPR